MDDDIVIQLLDSDVLEYLFFLELDWGRLLNRGCLLNMAGQISLAHSFLVSFPLYTMASVTLPALISDKIDRATWAFIWGSWEGARKMHLVSWQEVSKPRDCGWLGIRRMSDLNVDIYSKLS